ncbi:MAG TPA: tRNA preQ1(34) S-adenosylmethionine ribosyltransferase-isomerase QueA [Candidatus Sulfotelmatobacter sp.]
MLVSDFSYELPEELIAQQPLPDRASSRLLHLSKSSGSFEDRQFRDFPSLLNRADLVVFNNTKVFPARLYARRQGLKSQGLSPRNPASREFLRGRVEVLLTRQLQQDPNEWECLVRPGRKIAVGERLFFGEQDELEAEVISRGEFGERCIRFAPAADFFAIVEKIGHIPLPPYIARPDAAADHDRYQTVYARERGSVAAPTAGLHFTPEILAQLDQHGVEQTQITLHVGLGTFQPIRSEEVEAHHLHSEKYFISPETAAAIQRARSTSRRVIAIGTTTVRTLEYVARQNSGEVLAGGGEANLFIYPGFNFQVVQGVLTNFHLPQSTLLMLMCAFAGKEKMLRAYQHAVASRYRFYSYGDCMFVE